MGAHRRGPNHLSPWLRPRSSALARTLPRPVDHRRRAADRPWPSPPPGGCPISVLATQRELPIARSRASLPDPSCSFRPTVSARPRDLGRRDNPSTPGRPSPRTAPSSKRPSNRPLRAVCRRLSLVSLVTTLSDALFAVYMYDLQTARTVAAGTRHQVSQPTGKHPTRDDGTESRVDDEMKTRRRGTRTTVAAVE